MPLVLEGLGAAGKQDEPYILTVNDEGKLHAAMRQANREAADTYLDRNPAGGPYGDKYLVMVPYGQAPAAGAPAGGPFQIVRARGSIAAAASQGQYIVGRNGNWAVSLTGAPAGSGRGFGWWPIAAIGAVVLVGLYAATRRK